MVRRIVLTLLAVTTLPVGAQSRRRSSGDYNTDPGYWVGVSYGYLDGVTLGDDKTQSIWAFAYTSQIRATLEKTLSSGVSVGVSAGFSNPKLTYTGSALNTNTCIVCQADAQVNQYMAFFHSGGGQGFHALFNLEGGATQYSKFRDVDTGQPLAPTAAAYDMTFGFGGGFGYGLSRSSEVYVSEQLDLVLHHQGEVVGTQPSVPRMSVFRAGARVGF